MTKPRLSLLWMVEVPKPRSPQGCAPPGGSTGGGPIIASSSCLAQPLPSSSHGFASSLCAHDSVSFIFFKSPVLGFQAHLGNPGPSDPEILNYYACKDCFSK